VFAAQSSLLNVKGGTCWTQRIMLERNASAAAKHWTFKVGGRSGGVSAPARCACRWGTLTLPGGGPTGNGGMVPWAQPAPWLLTENPEVGVRPQQQRNAGRRLAVRLSDKSVIGESL
jgi:hypothetical protein